VVVNLDIKPDKSPPHAQEFKHTLYIKSVTNLIKFNFCKTSQAMTHETVIRRVLPHPMGHNSVTNKSSPTQLAAKLNPFC
jgi:hypothetical protein